MRILTLSALLLLCAALPAAAFMTEAEGCGAGSCIDCHSLNKEEAAEVLKQIQGEVTAVGPAEVPGLWRVEMKMQEKTFPLYLDFSKSYMIAGNVIRLEDRQNLTEQRFRELNPVDLARIPLEDALLLGSKEAKTKVVVFTDPHCPYCSKLHQEMLKAVEQRTDIAFLIKLLPLKKSSYAVTKTILCNRSMEMLEAGFAGKQLPPPTCEAPEVDLTIQLARELGIRSTPTLVLPDGRIAPGYKQLEHLLKTIDEATPQQ